MGQHLLAGHALADAPDPAFGQRSTIEPRLLALLLAKQERRQLGVYHPRNAAEIAAGVSALFAREGIAAQARDVRRMGGGASKEQFVFETEGPIDPRFARCVLRMDPREGIIETCRRREAQVLRAVAGIVPVPPVLCVDDGDAPDGDGPDGDGPDGDSGSSDALGQPLMITGFVGGVAKPTSAASGPSGVRAAMGEAVGAALAPQFLAHLVAIHGVDHADAGLVDYAVPRPGTTEAALWQLDYWTHVRTLEAVDSLPLLALAETWLRDRLPVCPAPVLLHGDYRVGNFLFDETSLEITALLDWELAHIGDFHEDLAYSFEPLFGSTDAQGRFLTGSMFPPEDLVARYAALTGRRIIPETLHWYRVLTSYKLITMNHCSSIIAARDGTNHQNALLAYLAACTASLSGTLCALLRENRR